MKQGMTTLLGVVMATMVLATPNGGAAAETGFDAWSTLARAAKQSPVEVAPGDLTETWTGPDGGTVHLVVRLPRGDGTSVMVGPVPPGADARPFFDAAIARARATGARRVNVQPGIYQFRSLGARGLGHWVVGDLSDVTIEGTGAVLVFNRNASGIYLHSNQRVRLHGLTLRYGIPLASLGHVEKVAGKNRLVLTPRVGAIGVEPVMYVSQYNAEKRRWVAAGQRLIFPPHVADSPRPLGGSVYTSAAFQALKPDHTYIAFHHFYGGVAIEQKDLADRRASEDIVLDRVTIRGAPGMAIAATRLKRGFAVVRSTVAPDEAAGDLISSEYDAIHAVAAGGDILIADNTIEGQGDDAINLSGAVHQVVALNEAARTLYLSTYARFIAKGDTLAMFDPANGQMFAVTTAATDAQDLGNSIARVTLEAWPAGLDATTLVRAPNLMGNRFAVLRNKISRCHCHGVLAQLPNGIIAENRFEHTNFNAIRLISNLGQWKEGTGAFNVLVRNNDIISPGPDSSLPFQFGAISAYGVLRGGVTGEPINDHIAIVDNRIRNASQACISVASSRNVAVIANTCVGSGKSARNAQIVIAPDSDVRASGNVTRAERN